MAAQGGGGDGAMEWIILQVRYRSKQGRVVGQKMKFKMEWTVKDIVAIIADAAYVCH